MTKKTPDPFLDPDPTFSDPGCCDMQKIDQAYKEIEILQSIISRQLDHSLKVRSWLFLILSGITVAYYNHKFLNTTAYLASALPLITMFWTLEAMQYSLLRFARKRMAEVERQVRDGADKYDGPLICISLKKAWSAKGVIANTFITQFSPLVMAQFVMLMTIVVLLVLVKQ
ncbi:MAG: hypothetical protein AAF823_10715 [Planctomycetota bacterium]